MKRKLKFATDHSTGEFLWLVSLSDLMILLFVFFVVIFSFTYQRMGKQDFQKIAQILTNQEKMTTPLDEIQAKLLKWVVDRKLMEAVTVEQKEDALILHIREKILFDAGAFDLKEESQELISLISQALEKIPAPYRIGIEGHTDDTPLSRGTIHDNWDLSTRRAHSVLTALHLSPAVRERAVIMGYGEMKPIVPNRDEKGNALPQNQAKNRRVTLRIF